MKQAIEFLRSEGLINETATDLVITKEGGKEYSLVDLLKRFQLSESDNMVYRKIVGNKVVTEEYAKNNPTTTYRTNG